VRAKKLSRVFLSLGLSWDCSQDATKMLAEAEDFTASKGCASKFTHVAVGRRFQFFTMLTSPWCCLQHGFPKAANLWEWENEQTRELSKWRPQTFELNLWSHIPSLLMHAFGYINQPWHILSMYIYTGVCIYIYAGIWTSGLCTCYLLGRYSWVLTHAPSMGLKADWLSIRNRKSETQIY
jgi:hypothetical protein